MRREESFRRLLSSSLMLARWRWRQHWFLLLMISLCIIASVVLICSTPLLTETMLTAGLRSKLNSYDRSELTLNATMVGLST